MTKRERKRQITNDKDKQPEIYKKNNYIFYIKGDV